MMTSYLSFWKGVKAKKRSLHFGAIAENPQRTSKAKGDPSDQDQSPPRLKHPISLIPHSMISILQRWLKWIYKQIDDTHGS